jgi:hypothetical protein
MTTLRMYDGDGDRLLEVLPSQRQVRVLPAGDPHSVTGRPRIRLLWGHHILDDLVAGRYRTVICGINDVDNSKGVVAELLRLVPGSQWSLSSATSYARVFRDAISLHAKEDREPYVLKFDLDRLLILALLRPRGRDHFTLEDLYRGFRTAQSMLDGRRDRQPVATVSFIGAKSNRAVDHEGREPSLEAVLRAMHSAGFEGDLYPPPSAWETSAVGAYAAFPFPESLARARDGSS